MKKQGLENYTPKGGLEGFPKEIIDRMLDYQEEQGGKRDISVFERTPTAGCFNKGFTWENTKEGRDFWIDVLINKDFDTFFEKYPKQDNQQEFRINDKVYDILRKEVGVVREIEKTSNIAYGLSVEFKSGLESYTIKGCFIDEYKNPQLLHYRNDYDYDVIDFNNLPKRQEHHRWRAKNGEVYYYIRFETKGRAFTDGIRDIHGNYDNDNYNSGNYFQTEAEAQSIALKLNEYFKLLIQN